MKPRKASEKCQTSCMSGKSASLAEDHESDNMTKKRDQVLKLKTEAENCLPAQTKAVSKLINAVANHTLYGQCLFPSERDSLMDTAKVLY